MVPHSAQILEEPHPTPAVEVAVECQHSVEGLAALGRRESAHVGPAQHQPHTRQQMGTSKDIVALAIAAVGQVGLLVVFKAINGAVVVHVDPVEEFGPVRVEAEKGLLVVGDKVRSELVVVLVEIGNKVVVLVPAGKDIAVPRCPALAPPVGLFVLIVVVIDELVERKVVAVVERTLLLGG